MKVLPQVLENDDGLDFSRSILTIDDLPHIGSLLPGLAAKFKERSFSIKLGDVHFAVQDVDVLVTWLKGYPRLSVSIRHASFGWHELYQHILKKDQPIQLMWFLIERRLGFCSIAQDSLVHALMAKQFDILVKQADNLRRWQQKESFVCEKEVNRCYVQYYTNKGYAVDTFYPGANDAGFAVLLPDGKHAYSFDGAYVAVKEAEQHLLLGEVKHSMSEDDVIDLVKKICMLKRRFQKIADGSTPPGNPFYSKQLELLSKFRSVTIKPYIGAVHIDAKALRQAAKHGCDVVMPSGGRFGFMTSGEAGLLADAWLNSAPQNVIAEEELW